MVSTSTVAEIGALLGDPARVNMMIALLDGRAKTAGELADAAGVTPQTASSHLAKLVAAEFIAVERQGRHRYHRLASPHIAQLLENMHVAGAVLGGRRRPGPTDPAMRRLRSCYDHLAGRIAVELSEKLLANGVEPQLTDEGARRLEKIGLDLKALREGRRPFCRSCLDWSERRPHIAGNVGAAILTRFKDLAWVRPPQQGRTLNITAAGERGLRDIFDIVPKLAD